MHKMSSQMTLLKFLFRKITIIVLDRTAFDVYLNTVYFYLCKTCKRRKPALSGNFPVLLDRYE